jgi:hypothetical protein
MSGRRRPAVHSPYSRSSQASDYIKLDADLLCVQVRTNMVCTPFYAVFSHIIIISIRNARVELTVSNSKLQ